MFAVIILALIIVIPFGISKKLRSMVARVLVAILGLPISILFILLGIQTIVEGAWGLGSIPLILGLVFLAGTLGTWQDIYHELKARKNEL